MKFFSRLTVISVCLFFQAMCFFFSLTSTTFANPEPGVTEKNISSVLDQVINMEGLVEANGLKQQKSDIVLMAEGEKDVSGGASYRW